MNISVRKILMVSCAGILLSSCGLSLPTPGTVSDSAQPPAGAVSSVSNDSVAPLSVPPQSGERPPDDPGSSPGFGPPRGINTSNLFGAKLDNDRARIDRLETAVQSLRNDFDSMAPAINRLTSVEEDIQELLTQLETLIEEPTPSSAVPSSAVPVQTAPVLPVPEIAQPDFAEDEPVALTLPLERSPAATGQGVREMRIGEHPDKTRIVLDAAGRTSFSTDLDNGERILIVELPDLPWSAMKTRSFANAPLIASYRAESINNGGGSRLILQLKKAVDITYAKTLDGTVAGEKRIVIDLSAKTSGAS